MINPRKLTLATLLTATAWVFIATTTHAADAPKSMRPGTQPKVARTFSTQPPVIPHAVDNFDEITLEENQCLSCHGPDVYEKKNAPMIGKSHFIDRNGNKLATTSSARHNCVQCHVPQIDAPPLVENAFKGDVVPATAAPAKKAKK